LQPSAQYLVIVQLLIPVKQRLQTNVTREAFIADPTAWDRFKDGVIAKLGTTPQGVPYSRENVIIDSISTVSSRRMMLQGSEQEDAASERRLAAGILEISYWISLIKQNVNPANYAYSAAFAASHAAVVASVSTAEVRSSIEASLAATSTGIQVTALAPLVASSPAEVIVNVLQGPPTLAPTPADGISTAPPGWMQYAYIAAGCVLTIGAAAALIRCRKRLQGARKTEVSVSPGTPQQSSVKLVGTIDSLPAATSSTTTAEKGMEESQESEWASPAAEHSGAIDTTTADYAIDVREAEDSSSAFVKDDHALETDNAIIEQEQFSVLVQEESEPPLLDVPAIEEDQAAAAGSESESGAGESSADTTDDEEDAPAVAQMDTKVTAAAEEEASALEHLYQPARYMFEQVCAAQEFADSSKQVLIIAHSNFSQEVFAYAFADPEVTGEEEEEEEAKAVLLEPYKLPRYQPGEPVSAFVAVSDAERRSRYCVERVGEDERDYPGVMEMPVPLCVALKHPACAQGVGRLLGAMNFPMLLRDVIIDIWGIDIPDGNDAGPGPVWATATVDGIAYAVLERLCISKMQQQQDDGGDIAEVQIFARHPRSNMLALEHYTDQ
jgi:hypothetical protein